MKDRRRKSPQAQTEEPCRFIGYVRFLVMVSATTKKTYVSRRAAIGDFFQDDNDRFHHSWTSRYSFRVLSYGVDPTATIKVMDKVKRAVEKLNAKTQN